MRCSGPGGTTVSGCFLVVISLCVSSVAPSDRLGHGRRRPPARVGTVKRLVVLADPVNEVDRGISRRIAALPPSRLDTVMKGLTTAANHSLLWFAVAAGLGLRRGATRKAAARGVLAIALASTSANAICKPLLPRRRPAAADAACPEGNDDEVGGDGSVW